MLGIYFSGTGNTKYCVERFLGYYDGSKPISIENPDVTEAMRKAETIVLGYPIYYSNIPKIMRDFIYHNRANFNNKNVFIICTMGLFSGDGAGCSARLLKRYGANIVGGLHLKMPDCKGDVKLLKKSLEENKQLVKSADNKIKDAVDSIKRGRATKDGLNILCHAAGLFGQRLWFYKKTLNYTNKLKIDKRMCIGCSRCVSLCPMSNLSIFNQKASADSKCTMCYRCISNCPQKAITLLGKEVIEQCLMENYLAK
ncbi:EFR1 family ferrodoxin [Dehalobacterium formicoaceticum]|uniref:EFR1 family ferrodoxin n=1 Tax=Dehalobacterium formicoaceticum TaxID=51515 RepID=A0ABT1Y8K8_9FIRM|nr:EFR1 family ferrodoxin [Dehalobacterium formicoaceticum]MCR6545981.1 EFR1 family ferrodoxin [Dehalobacterium formicoaceticum]